MSYQCPDERNKTARVMVSILLRPVMLETLRQMFEASKGEGGCYGTFEAFLVEHLENLAADFRAKQWRSEHGSEAAKPERKPARTGALYRDWKSGARVPEEEMA